MIKVRMTPHLEDVKINESGIHTVIRQWFKHLPDYGIQLVGKKEDSFDILAVHAGMSNRYPADACVVSHIHGLYWSSDYSALAWEWQANASVIESLRRACQITTPSNWVAETVQRDMRINPTVVPHGVDWDEWQHTLPNDGYILAYAKNRVMDVCNPAFITELAYRHPDKLFICTFAPKDAPANVRVTGLLPHDTMKQYIQRAAVVISPIKETWGILQAEALASGTPVLGYAYGGNLDIIRHGVSGYLAQPGNIDDLAAGLHYCLQYRDTLGKNGSMDVKERFTWDTACKILAGVYQSAMRSEKPSVSVVIPAYNYADKVGRAIQSVLDQTRTVGEIIVVDDGSPDDGATERAVSAFAESLIPVKYHRQNNAGVAVARNTGIGLANGKYITCLDADDALAPEFVHACLDALEADPLLGIAYTGLLAIEPDGRQSVSEWPPVFNPDNFVYPGSNPDNSIPTCNMFRKSMWERLGGYRSRYCPEGAGEEDAEFWLRAILHGFDAKKVTDAPLFIYSYRSGQVSGNRQHRFTNWRELHPSTRDHLHPFPCVATPINNKPSHPVRQYDEPTVSVIIPVGPGHQSQVINALDSLESQTIRKWEAIVVDDTGSNKAWEFDGVQDVMQAYPYVRMVKTPGKQGAGYARNRGVEAARAGLITFLDADDNFLVPEALEKMLDGWNETGMAVYTDYVSKAIISGEEAEKLRISKRLLEFDPQTGLGMHYSHATDYDCERAVVQPANPLYIWNLITTLFPRQWHFEVGGFDETMPSWEDWEYWLRMARAGKCFAHLPEPMVAYRFYTGVRRETGIQMPGELLSYITTKLEGVEVMAKGCSSCGKKNQRVSVPVTQVQRSGAPTKEESKLMSDNDMIMCTYDNPNRGGHKVVGPNTKIVYGYRKGGGTDRFYVHKDDIASQPDWFHPYVQPVVYAAPTPVAPPPPPAPVWSEPVAEPKPLPIPPPPVPDFMQTKPASESAGPGQVAVGGFKVIDFQSIPGVTNTISDALHKQGVKTWADVVELGEAGLLAIEGIGPKRAESILRYAQKQMS